MNNFGGDNSRKTKPYDLFIMVVSFLSLYPAVRLLFNVENEEMQTTLIALDWVFSIIFMLDFILAFIQAPSKLQFLKWGWIDFFGSLPEVSLLRPLRLLRVIRIIRIFRRTNKDDILNLFTNELPQSIFWITASIIMILLIVSSTLILYFEKASANANITNEYDALWWALVTISTVGYGDHVPITPQGRALAMFLMLMGISTFSILTSYLSSTFTGSAEEQQEKKLERITQELAEIKSILSNIQQAGIEPLSRDRLDEHSSAPVRE